jgi:hypothetical protein
MEIQQGGRLPHNGGRENPRGSHRQRTPTSDDPVRNAEVGSALAGPLEDQQLMANEGRLGEDGGQFTGAYQANNGNDYRNEKQKDVAHRGMVPKPQKWPEFSPIFVIRHPKVRHNSEKRQPHDSPQ